MDCENHCYELDEIIEDLRSTLEQGSGGKATLRASSLSRATALHKKARRQMHSLRVDSRGLEKAEQTMFQQRLKAYEEEVTKLNLRITELKNNTGEEEQEAPGPNGARMKVAGKIDEIDAIQTKIISSLTVSLSTVAQTQQIADKTATDLQRQKDELDATRDALRELEGNVKRARREMQAFMRRMMSDKVVLVMMFILVLGIVVMIVFKAAHMNRKK